MYMREKILRQKILRHRHRVCRPPTTRLIVRAHPTRPLTARSQISYCAVEKFCARAGRSHTVMEQAMDMYHTLRDMRKRQVNDRG